VSIAGISLVVLGIEESNMRMEGLLQSVFNSFFSFGQTCISHPGYLNVALMILRPMVMLSLDEEQDK
jgi:hypothetical protein